MVTTVLIVLMILALLEIVLPNGARLFFMIASAPFSSFLFPQQHCQPNPLFQQ